MLCQPRAARSVTFSFNAAKSTTCAGCHGFREALGAPQARLRRRRMVAIVQVAMQAGKRDRGPLGTLAAEGATSGYAAGLVLESASSAFPTSRSASSTCLALEARRRRQADSRCGFPTATPPALARLAGTPDATALRSSAAAMAMLGSSPARFPNWNVRVLKASREPYTGTLGASGPRSSVGSARYAIRGANHAQTPLRSVLARCYCWIVGSPLAMLNPFNHAADTAPRGTPPWKLAGLPFHFARRRRLPPSRVARSRSLETSLDPGSGRSPSRSAGSETRRRSRPRSHG